MMEKQDFRTNPKDSLPYRVDPKQVYHNKIIKTRTMREKRKLSPSSKRKLNAQTRQLKQRKLELDKKFDEELNAPTDRQDLSNVAPEDLYENIDDLRSFEDLHSVPPTDEEYQLISRKLGELIDKRTSSGRCGSYKHVASDSKSSLVTEYKSQFSLSSISETVSVAEIINSQGSFNLLADGKKIEKNLVSSTQFPVITNVRMELEPILFVSPRRPRSLVWWDDKISQTGANDPHVLDVKYEKRDTLFLIHKLVDDIKLCCVLENTGRSGYVLLNYVFISSPVSTPDNVHLVEFSEFLEDNKCRS